MKKGVLLLLLFSIFLMSFVIAEDGVSEATDDKAYACLEDRFNKTNCGSLSSEGQIFALLTIGECRDYVLNISKDHPSIKLTSQAILALDNVGVDITNATDWLWSQNQTPTTMNWYLQIDSSDTTYPTNCTVTYGGSTDKVIIAADKKITSLTSPGNCLSQDVAYGDYWLKIKKGSSCYNQEYETSCGADGDSLTFKTNLLFTNPADSGTIHVSPNTHTGSAGGAAEPEKIAFSCFKKGSACDYEGTLWATLVLNHLGHSQDRSSMESYLATLYDTNPNPTYLPESFLYLLTGADEFADKLMPSSNAEGYWSAGGDRYYDTALALLATKGSNSWDKAVLWLEDKQDESGCWNGNNFIDTAFILYSVWPRGVSLSGMGGGIVGDDGEVIPSTEDESCTEAGYFCMAGISCGGSALDQYDCDGYNSCCSQEQDIETCSSLNGDICNSNQQCAGGTSESTFDLDYGQTCCVEGACEEKAAIEEYTCSSSGGTCRIEGCETGEESSFETCEFGDTCCVAETGTKDANYLWLWILVFLILIASVAIGIVKRDKLREYLFRLKSKFKKKPSGPPGRRPMGRPMGGPVTPAATQRRLMQGRPPAGRPPVRRPSKIARPSSKAPGEINDVLKKLKDMGK